MLQVSHRNRILLCYFVVFICLVMIRVSNNSGEKMLYKSECLKQREECNLWNDGDRRILRNV